jgi:hypothetical protein
LIACQDPRQQPISFHLFSSLLWVQDISCRSSEEFSSLVSVRNDTALPLDPVEYLRRQTPTHILVCITGEHTIDALHICHYYFSTVMYNNGLFNLHNQKIPTIHIYASTLYQFQFFDPCSFPGQEARLINSASLLGISSAKVVSMSVNEDALRDQ